MKIPTKENISNIYTGKQKKNHDNTNFTDENASNSTLKMWRKM